MQVSETGGAQAEYSTTDGRKTVRRDIFGWDGLGRPLVMCGERLVVAADAVFAHYPRFLKVVKPDFAAEIRAAVTDQVRVHVGALYDPVHDAVSAALTAARDDAVDGPVADKASLTPMLDRGISAGHFEKPMLLRIHGVSRHLLLPLHIPVMRPTVDYIVLDPVTGTFTEVQNQTITERYIGAELVACYQRGLQVVTGVMKTVPGSSGAAVKVLRALDDNSNYGAKVATRHLAAAATQLGWWTAAETDQPIPGAGAWH